MLQNCHLAWVGNENISGLSGLIFLALHIICHYEILQWGDKGSLHSVKSITKIA